MKKGRNSPTNHIPWKGYFDFNRGGGMNSSFMMTWYTKRDWRNRNLIKTPQGLVQWSPCRSRLREVFPDHCETETDEADWENALGGVWNYRRVCTLRR